MTLCPFGVGDSVVVAGSQGTVISTSTVGGRTMLHVRLNSGSTIIVDCAQASPATRAMRGASTPTRDTPPKAKAVKKKRKVAAATRVVKKRRAVKKTRRR